jgi:hypothetical protein
MYVVHAYVCNHNGRESILNIKFCCIFVVCPLNIFEFEKLFKADFQGFKKMIFSHFLLGASFT